MDAKDHPDTNLTHPTPGPGRSERVNDPMPINRDGADYNIRSGAASGTQMGTKPGKFDLTGDWKNN